jgi:hypothetical protein
VMDAKTRAEGLLPLLRHKGYDEYDVDPDELAAGIASEIDDAVLDEREACAKRCETYAVAAKEMGKPSEASSAEYLATCIRSRGPATPAPIRCDHGDECPGHASPFDRPCNWEPAPDAPSVTIPLHLTPTEVRIGDRRFVPADAPDALLDAAIQVVAGFPEFLEKGPRNKQREEDCLSPRVIAMRDLAAVVAARKAGGK